MSLKNNTLWNLVGSGLPLLAGVLTIPYTLHRLGNEAFGVLTLVWGLIGYFSLFDFGIGRALTVEISRRMQQDAAAPVGAVLRAGLFLTALAGLLGAVVVALLAHSLAERWLSIGPALQGPAMQAFWVTALGVIPTTLSSGLRGALEGMNRFATSNLSRVAMGAWMFIAPALAIAWQDASVGGITIYLVVGRFVVMAGLFIPLLRVLTQGGRGFDRTDLANLWGYGIWVTITGIIGPLMVFGDRFFVSAAVGADQLPLYAIPQEGLLRLLLIPGALTSALLPRLAAAAPAEAAQEYRRQLARVAWLMGGISVVALGLAHPVLRVWISDEFATRALPIVAVLCVGIWINSIASLPFTLLQARGNPRLTALFHLAELAAYLVVLSWAAGHWGLMGAAIAWVARVMLDAVLLQVAVRRLYGV